MDTLCGLGLPELIILALLGFVVIGPQRTQEVALKAGRLLRQMMTSSWWGDFQRITQALRDLPNLPTALVRMAALEDEQQEIRRVVTEIEEGTRIDLSMRGVSSGGTAERDVITDPWGIRNATAGTRVTPRRKQAAESPAPSTSQPQADEGLDA